MTIAMTIGSLEIRPMGVLMMCVPFVLAILAVFLRSMHVSKRTAGYVSNAGGFSYFLLMVTIFCIIVTLLAGLYDPNLNFFNKGLGVLVVLTFLFFVCYYIIAFKPVTAEQLEEARDDGAPLFEVAGLAAAGVAAGVSGTIGWTLKMLARAPIDIVRQTGNTIWYRNASVGGFMGNIATTLIVLFFAALILVFFAMWFLLFIVVISWVLVVYKFVKNLIYLGGPRG